MRSIHAALFLAAGVCPQAVAQTTQRVSISTAGWQSNSFSNSPSISADGRFVAFGCLGGLVQMDFTYYFDVYVRDCASGTTELVSVNSNGQQGNAQSHRPSISADGRWVAFTSLADNLVTGDGNHFMDAFVHDRLGGATERVSIDSSGAQANGDTYQAWISGDGRFVLMQSDASNLAPGDTNGATDAFVRDRLLGTTRRVSVDSSAAQADAACIPMALSADGRWLLFTSAATNLVPGDTNGRSDVYVRDLMAGITERVSLGSGGAEGNGDSGTNGAALSADGRFVAFWSAATNLLPGVGAEQLYLRDRLLGTLECLSTGPGGVPGNGESRQVSLSADGRQVAFYSNATNLGPTDENGHGDVYVRDRQLGTTAIASVDPAGGPADSASHSPVLSADGHVLAFASHATNLVPGDTNNTDDIFARDFGLVSANLSFCFGDGFSGSCPCANFGSGWRGCQNSAGSGGARLDASGNPSLANDSLLLASSGEVASATSILLQGTQAVAPLAFGDGLRCTGGTLRRLYVQNALAGQAVFPAPGMPSISARSAALGDPFGAGSLRAYQAYYRDPDPGFCPAPAGSTFDISSALAVTWGN